MTTIRPMSAQNAFTKVVKHLRKQGEQSLDEIVGCVYRGANGLQCAVGCLIPDDKYREGMEGDSVSSLVEFTGWSGKAMSVLEDLQNLHDQTDVSYWEGRFKEIAKEQGLKLPSK